MQRQSKHCFSPTRVYKLVGDVDTGLGELSSGQVKCVLGQAKVQKE